MEGPSSVSVPNFKWIALFVRKLLGGSQNFEIVSLDRGHANLRGRFIFRTQQGCVLHRCTKFEADSSIHSKVTKGVQNLEIRSRDPGHAHLGVGLWPVLWLFQISSR